MRISSAQHLAGFYDIVQNQRRKTPVMVLYIDGLGYEHCMQQCQKGNLPFMEDNFVIFEMETVKEALTNPAYATMITGKLPKEHGVFTRRDHHLNVSTLFAEGGEHAALIEGDCVILQTEIPAVLNTATKEKNIDRAVLESAQKAIEQQKTFLFVHFHGVDDTGHSFGPESMQYGEKLREVDGYVKMLCEIFNGTVFFISDHGLTKCENGGAHGTGTKTELYVPFGVYSGTLKRQVGDYEGFSVAELFSIIKRDGDSQLVVCGEDGFAAACSKEELSRDKMALLVKENGGYRMVFPAEAFSRRWCKHICEIQVR